MSNSTSKRAIYLLLTLASMLCTYSTLTGDLQKTIHFTGTTNEMAFVMVSFMLSIGFAYLTISKIEE
jgi:hypothetical protein